MKARYIINCRNFANGRLIQYDNGVVSRDRPIHFIGVCGTAMAAAAIDLSRQGWAVTGSDSQFYPPMSDLLAESRVSVRGQFDPSNLPQDGFVVVGNAVSRGNLELEEALNRRLPLVSLPELIRFHYLPGKRTLVVAGTHGKTTTTSMAAHVYRTLGWKPGWMIGGEPVDLPWSCDRGDGDLFVIEGDEYDTAWFDKRPKFLLYRPYDAILTSVEFDHSDIYGSIEEIEAAFCRLAGLLPAKGTLICCGDDPRALRVAETTLSHVVTYGTGNSCQWRVRDVTGEGAQGATGEITSPEGTIRRLNLRLSGTHNLLNALAVVAHSGQVGAGMDDVIAALESFRGVARRLQVLARNDGIILYDDFAHHPTAIKATLTALRKRHPQGRFVALVEPRSNTMVRNYFQRELEDALALADRVILGPLHRRERIPPDARLDVPKLLGNLQNRGVEATALESFDEAAGEIERSLVPGDVVAAMSNGSFGGITQELAERIKARK